MEGSSEASAEVSFDPAVLEALAATQPGEEGPALVARVVGLFVKSSSDLHESMQAGLDADDAEKVASAAHTLKSSSAQVGAHLLSSLCKQIEATARAGSLSGVAESLEELASEIPAVHEKLAACQAELARV